MNIILISKISKANECDSSEIENISAYMWHVCVLGSTYKNAKEQ
jgi:hypothetical protein